MQASHYLSIEFPPTTGPGSAPERGAECVNKKYKQKIDSLKSNDSVGKLVTGNIQVVLGEALTLQNQQLQITSSLPF